MKVELQIDDTVIKDILNDANTQIAIEMATWLNDKSKEGFYAELSETIESTEDGIVGSGLTEYIMTKRELTNEFIETL